MTIQRGCSLPFIFALLLLAVALECAKSLLELLWEALHLGMDATEWLLQRLQRQESAA